MNNYSNDERTFSYLAYIGPLCLIGLFSDLRSNPTLRFHLNQGLVLFLCEMAALIIHSIICFSLYVYRTVFSGSFTDRHF